MIKSHPKLNDQEFQQAKGEARAGFSFFFCSFFFVLFFVVPFPLA